jgi:HPt (histidine-containing phosphotransfer) domain-containing protein
MTAHAMAGDREKSLAAGMNDHVTKPIDPRKLFKTLLQWIRPDRITPQDVSDGPVTAALRPSQDVLPDFLPGFDLADGLRRLQGNQKLYAKLLRTFAVDYADRVEEIRAAVKQNDMEQARSLAHAVKGVAGNLAAAGLQDAAAEVELLAKQVLGGEEVTPGVWDNNLAVLEEVLLSAVEGIQTWSSIEAPAAATPEPESADDLSPEWAQQAAVRLREAAELGDVSGLVSTAEELKADCEAFAPTAERIVGLAEDFDFDAIIDMAGKLESGSN